MQIPIYIDGVQEGKLSIVRQGNMTAFEADMRDVGRVVRLRVFGDGDGYLGIPAPANGRQRLVKHMSPAAMRGFPKQPEYAAEQRQTQEKKAEQRQMQEKKGDQTENEQVVQPKHVIWMGGKPYYF